MSIMRLLCPANNTGDAIFSWYRFVKRHRRLPRKSSALVNDRLYRMKVDGTLLDPLRQFISGKEYVKLYVAVTVGDNYNIETFDVLRKISELDDYIPDRFPCVVKPTHSSGRVRICHTPHDFPSPEELRRWMSFDLYTMGREQNYKFLRPKIIVEEFMSLDGSAVPEDYKIYCFQGSPRFIHVDGDRFSDHTRNFYDIDWRRLHVEWGYPGRISDDPKPENLTEMINIASVLSKPFDFIRVDLYTVGTELRVGELTNCPGNANEAFAPKQMERELCYW